MPALRCVAPDILRDILIKYAFEVVGEDHYNWILVRGEKGIPITLPKQGDLVALDVMENALNEAKMDNGTFFRFLDEVTKERSNTPTIEEKS
ncbi:MAG: hypothetical protein MJA29_06985 [Candidatus Omnitrophica bacterium]|nr:hypothetical protein [Candidatus Omnitrophota bacterium]